MNLKDKHIFIVEDDMHNRVIFQVLLNQHGAQVYFEKSGRESLYRLRQLPHVELIILDLMLAEGYSGLDIFDEIRSIPEYDQVPILAVSATDPSIGIPQTQARGFSGFISKPIEKSQFAAQIDTVLKGEQVWQYR